MAKASAKLAILTPTLVYRTSMSRSFTNFGCFRKTNPLVYFPAAEAGKAMTLFFSIHGFICHKLGDMQKPPKDLQATLKSSCMRLFLSTGAWFSLHGFGRAHNLWPWKSLEVASRLRPPASQQPSGTSQTSYLRHWRKSTKERPSMKITFTLFKTATKTLLLPKTYSKTHH